MKKLTVIILSLLMIFVLAACGAKCEEHTYDNVCDTECNVCGTHRSIMHRFAPADCLTPATCEFCGATQGDPLGHTPVTDAAVESTCTASGLTEGSHCSVCFAVIVEQTEVPVKPHDFTSSTVTAPTCTSNGYTTYYCSCGYEQVVTDTPALEHDWLDASCLSPKTCSVCGATEGDPTEHEYADVYTIVDGGHKLECICHPEFSVEEPHSDLDGDTLCDDCSYELNCLYTVTLEYEHEGIRIDLTSLTDGTTHTVYTAENGTATVSLPKGEYSVNITHYNSGYLWLDKDNGVTLTEKNSTYTADFDVSTERIEYDINVYDADGTPFSSGGTVMIYFPDGENESYLAINGRGMAITFMYNGDYVASVYAGGVHKIVSFKKDGPTTVDVYMDSTEPVGSLENPMIIYDLTDLPYMDDAIAMLPFDNSYDFEAGESLYVIVPFANKKVITLGTEALTVECGGVALVPNGNGEYILTAPYGESVILKLTATEACTEGISVDQPGSMNNPFSLPTSSFNRTDIVELAAGESVYYEIYCYAGSTLKVSAPGTEVTVNGGEMPETFEDDWYDICITAIEAGSYEILIEYVRN